MKRPGNCVGRLEKREPYGAGSEPCDGAIGATGEWIERQDLIPLALGADAKRVL
jgi:hypothetical protein